MPLYPKCVVTCAVILGNDLLKGYSEHLHIQKQNSLKHNQECIFVQGLYFKYIFQVQTPLYAFDPRLIERPVIFRVYSSIFTHFQDILRDNLGYSRIFLHYSGLFRHVQAYSESYVNALYLEPWNISKPAKCRTQTQIRNNCIFRFLEYSEPRHMSICSF